MTEHCTICGDPARERSRISIHDETDASARHLEGKTCAYCYEALMATVERLAA